MQLVIGGIASGKRTYVRSMGYREDQMSPDPHAAVPVLLDFEELLRDDALTSQELDDVCDKDVVVCLEVGLGVVPIDTRERVWRERVGRICQALAKHATSVTRLVCGIPVRLK